MLRNNKNNWTKLPKLSNYIFTPNEQQNALKPTCHRIHNLKQDQQQLLLNTQGTSEYLRAESSCTKQNNHSARSTLLLKFPIGKNMKKNDIFGREKGILGDDDENNGEQNDESQHIIKRVLQPTNRTHREHRRKMVNESALSIRSVNKQDNDQNDIFMNRATNYLQRRDVRARMIKYMKDVDERNNIKILNNDRTCYRAYMFDSRGSPFEMYSKEMVFQKLDNEKLQGWNTSEERVSTEDLLQSIGSQTQTFK